MCKNPDPKGQRKGKAKIIKIMRPIFPRGFSGSAEREAAAAEANLIASPSPNFAGARRAHAAATLG